MHAHGLLHLTRSARARTHARTHARTQQAYAHSLAPTHHKVHAFLHSMHAGFFDCGVDWGTYLDDNPSVTIQRLSFFANIVIQFSVDIDLYFSMDVPSSCTLGVDTVDTCLATSSQFTSVEQIDALNGTGERKRESEDEREGEGWTCARATARQTHMRERGRKHTRTHAHILSPLSHFSYAHMSTHMSTHTCRHLYVGAYAGLVRCRGGC